MITPSIKIAFDIPAEIQNGFPSLLEKTRRHIVRQALRSALAPSRNLLKTKLMGLAKTSRQSTGASLRAVGSKYRNARYNPNRFYGIVSINRKYVEYMDTDEKSVAYPGALYRQFSFGIKKKRWKPGDSPFLKRWPRQEVRTLARRRQYRGLGVSKKRLRKPNKYWHLSEYGFTRGKAHFAGHRFVDQVIAATESEARAIFETQIREHFRRAKG